LASADELLREAQYALQNVSPGSTDEYKYTVRAKSYALQVVQKYPHSIEAAQAREILAQLKIQIAKPASPTLTGRPLAAALRSSAIERPLAAPAVHPKMNRFAARAATTDDQWRAIFTRFIAVPSGKKKLFFVVLLFFVALLPFSLFVVAGVVVLYAFNLPLLKKHLLVLLDRLESGK
jgi:hypothetical protein